MIWNILEGARSLMGTDYPEKELVIRPGALVTSLVLNVLCSVAQLCLTLCNPIDGSPPGSSVHGILQARILEWVGISFSRGSSQLRNRTCTLSSPALAGRFSTTESPGKEVPNRCIVQVGTPGIKPAELNLKCHPQPGVLNIRLRLENPP